jgi:hypothetical protein
VWTAGTAEAGWSPPPQFERVYPFVFGLDIGTLRLILNCSMLSWLYSHYMQGWNIFLPDLTKIISFERWNTLVLKMFWALARWNVEFFLYLSVSQFNLSAGAYVIFKGRETPDFIAFSTIILHISCFSIYFLHLFAQLTYKICTTVQFSAGAAASLPASASYAYGHWTSVSIHLYCFYLARGLQGVLRNFVFWLQFKEYYGFMN